MLVHADAAMLLEAAGTPADNKHITPLHARCLLWHCMMHALCLLWSFAATHSQHCLAHADVARATNEQGFWSEGALTRAACSRQILAHNRCSYNLRHYSCIHETVLHSFTKNLRAQCFHVIVNSHGLHCVACCCSTCWQQYSCSCQEQQRSGLQAPQPGTLERLGRSMACNSTHEAGLQREACLQQQTEQVLWAFCQLISARGSPGSRAQA
jgi:hypothetical protein